jgi:VWFA-related protein
MMRPRLVFLGFAFALGAHVLFAQAEPGGTPAAQFSLNVRTVLEDVVVTDKTGKAVPGLRKEDFQVFENGKPQAITFFEPNFAATDPVSVPAALPPDTFTNVSSAAANNVTNVFLLDVINTRSTEQIYAQVQMVKYLAALPPNLRVGVFTLDYEKFHITVGIQPGPIRTTRSDFTIYCRASAGELVFIGGAAESGVDTCGRCREANRSKQP